MVRIRQRKAGGFEVDTWQELYLLESSKVMILQANYGGTEYLVDQQINDAKTLSALPSKKSNLKIAFLVSKRGLNGLEMNVYGRLNFLAITTGHTKSKGNLTI